MMLAALAAASAISTQPLEAAAAFSAKALCSGVFVSHRDPEAVGSVDLRADRSAAYSQVTQTIDHNERSVTSSYGDLLSRKAIYRDGLGCVLVIGASEASLRAQAAPRPAPKAAGSALWPQGGKAMKRPPKEVDARGLSDALDAAFQEPDPDRLRRTRAVVVVYRGRIIAERYAPGISPDTPLLGNSMSKSMTNALVGVLVGKGKLALADTDLAPEWRRDPQDPRRHISLDHLLRMSSGLRWGEATGSPVTDNGRMLLTTGDMAAMAADQPLEAAPGTKWQYSSATTNIIARLIKERHGGSLADYHALPRRAVFDPLGMKSAVFEADASGTLVGSTSMYASARDWARLGLLYLRDGVWDGRRILPASWVAYSTAPAPAALRGQYGAQFWREIPGSYRSDGPERPKLPADMYSMVGHAGQFVTIVPSSDLVIVRMGWGLKDDAWDHERFVKSILDAVGKAR